LKLIFFIFIIFFANLVHAQTPVDSLNVTPNPFQKRTCAFYSFQNNDTISLTIYNTIGQIILSPKTNSLMPSGFYQDSLIMDAFPDGIYFAVLKIGKVNTINKKIIKSATAGISQIVLSFDLTIFPNPASNTLWIATEQSNFINSEIIICNYLGQPILKLPFSNSVDVSSLSQGYYFLKFITENGKEYNSKFIKQ
jgi:hypothetical protein